jgi:sulfur relay protein TusB/DsrH
MPTLHTFRHGLSGVNNLQALLPHIHEHDVLILIENAVAIPADHDVFAKLNTAVFYLKDDCLVRGISPSVNDSQLINYTQLVELMIQHEKMVAW